MASDRERRGNGPPAMATRPRYPRIGAAAASLVVTLVAVLGAVGLLPVDSSAATQVSQPGAAAAHSSSAAGSGSADGGTLQMAGQSTGQSTGPSTSPSTSHSTSHSTALPVDSGTGRRVVFDMSNQRVWLVGPHRGDVRRTYLVSGSVTDNLKPGTYTVYSTSKHALGVDDSGTMRYMVRFAHGAHAAIGFHDIPVRDGRLVQGRDDLGTPQSHGCIRQWRPDAKALWRFAPVGTKVVVVA